MQLTAIPNKKTIQAVQTSMRIEGYQAALSSAVKEQVKALMVQHCVQIKCGGINARNRI